MFMNCRKGTRKTFSGKDNWQWKSLPREAVKFHLLEVFKVLAEHRA